ncbi:MAG: RNA methyltransferase [Candidatus Thermoplasmatota archaeon]
MIPEFYVVLVEPKYGGNIGSIARLMMNFDFSNLILVNPCRFDDDCYRRAMHASSVIDQARICSSFEDAVADMDYLVATSCIESLNDKRHLRKAVLLNDFVEKVYDVEGKVGLIFGREDYGLFNEEIAVCDILVKIPTSDVYPSLNVSHAVGLVLYELYVHRFRSSRVKKRGLSRVERDKLYEFFMLLLDAIDYPKHKRDNTMIMFRRLMGRAMPSKWEYHTLMGVLGESVKRIKQGRR